MAAVRRPRDDLSRERKEVHKERKEEQKEKKETMVPSMRAEVENLSRELEERDKIIARYKTTNTGSILPIPPHNSPPNPGQN